MSWHFSQEQVGDLMVGFEYTVMLYAISVLLQRQNDKVFPPFPIWEICTFDGNHGEELFTLSRHSSAGGGQH